MWTVRELHPLFPKGQPSWGDEKGPGRYCSARVTTAALPGLVCSVGVDAPRRPFRPA